MEAWTILLLFILGVIVIHYIGDFVAQSDWEAQNKSSSNWALLSHTSTYALWWIPFMISFFTISIILKFVIITFIAHTITDYITSRINKRLAVKAKETGNWHNFFLSIGFDQVLHYVQLFSTFYYLLNKYTE